MPEVIKGEFKWVIVSRSYYIGLRVENRAKLPNNLNEIRLRISMYYNLKGYLDFYYFQNVSWRSRQPLTNICSHHLTFDLACLTSVLRLLPPINHCLVYIISKQFSNLEIEMEKTEGKRIKLSDYDVMVTLGTGSFGRVKLTKHKATGKYFALKMLKKAEIVKSKQVDHVLNENHILNQLNHPFIVNMEGFAQDQRYLYFMLQFVAGGELFTYLRTVGKLETEHAASYAAQVTLVFEDLHSKNIIYRDLKPENLLIAEDGFLKLTDFGFAKVVETRTFTLCGTPQYLAPEILLNQGHGKPVDWWTLGILIYEMNAGIDPFTDDDPMNIYQNILKGKIRFPKEFDKEAKSIVRHLLVSDLSKRYGNLKNGVNDIKEHRWFARIDWKNLLAKKTNPFYKPLVKKPGDVSNFGSYPDSNTLPPTLKPADDPFLNW